MTAVIDALARLTTSAAAVKAAEGPLTAAYGAAFMAALQEWERLAALPVAKRADLSHPSYGFRDPEMAAWPVLCENARQAAKACAAARRNSRKRVGPKVLALHDAARAWELAVRGEFARAPTDGGVARSWQFLRDTAEAIAEITQLAMN